MRLTLNPRKILVVLLIIAAAFLVSGCDVLSGESGCGQASQPKRSIEQPGVPLSKDQIKRNQEQTTEAPKKDAGKKGEDSLMEDREESPAGKPVELFTTNNIQGVQNGGAPARFTLDKKFYITKLGTYHWNDGQGTPPGTIGIKAADGKMYGPWKVVLDQKVYWIAHPDVYIPAGSYTVVDSDPSTWAQNTESGGQGMAWASGIPAK